MVLKSLRENASELEKAVFYSVYHSKRQRLKRVLALLVLMLKYISCGLILIWPVYLLLLLFILSPEAEEYFWYVAAFLPALIFWLSIYLKSAWKEYNQTVKNHVLNKGFIRELLFGA